MRIYMIYTIPESAQAIQCVKFKIYNKHYHHFDQWKTISNIKYKTCVGSANGYVAHTSTNMPSLELPV